MARPTRVTICEHHRILVELGEGDSAQTLLTVGFTEDAYYAGLYEYSSERSDDIFKMCETVRDLGIPFATHRTGGADYFIERFRDEGHVQGKFKRINFFGNDRDKNAPFVIEDF